MTKQSSLSFVFLKTGFITFGIKFKEIVKLEDGIYYSSPVCFFKFKERKTTTMHQNSKDPHFL